MSLTIQDAQKTARLARIRMKDDDLARTIAPLSKIIDLFDALEHVNTDNVAPLANVVDIMPALREDKVTDGGYAEKIMANAPEEAQGYFVVPKVVE